MPVLENIVVNGKPVPGVVIFSFANAVERGEGPALLAKALGVDTPFKTYTAVSPRTSGGGDHFMFRVPLDWIPAWTTMSIGDSEVSIATSNAGGDVSFLSDLGTTAHGPGRPDWNLKTISDTQLLTPLPPAWLKALSPKYTVSVPVGKSGPAGSGQVPKTHSDNRSAGTVWKVAASVLAVGIIGAFALYTFNGDDEKITSVSSPITTTTTIAAPTTTTTTTTTVPPVTAIAGATTTTQKSSSSSGSGSGSNDAMDLAFIQTLDEFGVPFSSARNAISVAHQSCSSIRQTPNKARAVEGVVDIAISSGAYTTSEAYDFVGLAILAYCPEFSQYVRN